MPATVAQLPKDKQSARRHWTEAATAIFILGFFVYCAGPAWHARFGPDEMMNMYWHWAPGAFKSAWSTVTLWSSIIRPVGAVYYLPLFSAFGLNPLPFNFVRLGLLLLSAFVFFRLALRISGSRAVAAAAAVPVAYHADIPNLAYSGSMIYDVLCGLFFFSALLYYVRLRQTNARLNLSQSCVFLGLYLLALNSKEMAVSLPVIVFAYELLFGNWKSGETRATALARAGPLLAAIAMTVVFIAGRTLGPNALTRVEPYRPVFTAARFFESSVRFLNTIFYTGGFTARSLILVWASLLALAIFSRDRRLLLLWVWVIVAPLPVAFLPDRTGGCLYIVVAGWALAAAILVEALGRRISSPRVAPAFLAAAVILYMQETVRRGPDIENTYLGGSDETERLIEQFHALAVRPAHGSEIVFLNDPFPTSFDTQFVAALSWKDRSLTYWLQHEPPLSESELARMNYVFDFAGGKLRQVRP